MSDGILYHGDCLDVLRAFPDACVDLIYLDPPFNSNRDFFGRDGQVAFRDRWRWDEQARREAASLEKKLSGTPGEALMPALSSLLGKSGMTAYLVMMANRLAELRRVPLALSVAFRRMRAAFPECVFARGESVDCEQKRTY